MERKVGAEQFIELVDALHFVDDPRVAGRTKHLLVDVLVLTVIAVLCGAEGITEIEEFGYQKQEWLANFLELPAGIPSHDTIARVLSLIDPAEFESAFNVWVKSTVSGSHGGSISIDGKSVNGTERGFNVASRPLQIVSAYSHQLGLSLTQSEAASSGLAESEAAIECIDHLDIEGVTVMADAGLNSNKLICRIREKKGHYLVPVKSNHKVTFAELTDIFSSYQGKSSGERDRGHGRKEYRSCRILSSQKLSDRFKERWPDAKVAIAVTRQRSEKDKRFTLQKTGPDGKHYYEKNLGTVKESTETTFYVSSRKLTPAEALAEIRKHWSIENSLHWVLDVAFHEDNWMVRAKGVARSLSVARKIAFNLIKLSNTKGSIKVRMKRAAWNNDFLAQLIFGA